MKLRSSGDREESACYRKLVELLYPDGLACPECGSKRFEEVGRNRKAWVSTHRCTRCQCEFNAWSGTLLQGARCPPSQILAVLMKALERVERRGRSHRASALPDFDQGMIRQGYASGLFQSDQVVPGDGSSLSYQFRAQEAHHAGSLSQS
jgi:DNA-directed RNA polymerase subunit RPC12/RpoP